MVVSFSASINVLKIGQTSPGYKDRSAVRQPQHVGIAFLSQTHDLGIRHRFQGDETMAVFRLEAVHFCSQAAHAEFDDTGQRGVRALQ
ncbi:MAG TPA: hypothetical protein VN283_14205 [Thiobacillus sp.]|nr:hypothetical protein [Thiobacillus sp.]